MTLLLLFIISDYLEDKTNYGDYGCNNPDRWSDVVKGVYTNNAQNVFIYNLEQVNRTIQQFHNFICFFQERIYFVQSFHFYTFQVY